MSASELFERVFTSAGSPVVTCGACGVTHFCQPNLEDDEYDELCKNRDAEPKKYIEHNWDSISCGSVDGKEYIPDCECDFGKKMECFIWNNRELILEYLKCRMQENAAKAGHELKLVQYTESVHRFTGFLEYGRE